MAKTTISAELAAKYPSLKDRVGETVDASVVQRAASDAKVNDKDGAKAKASANKVVSKPVAAKKRKAAAKK